MAAAVAAGIATLLAVGLNQPLVAAFALSLGGTPDAASRLATWPMLAGGSPAVVLR
jgi:hypothetical protein